MQPLPAKAATHTAAMLDAWRQAGVERADLAVRAANGAMRWHADCFLDQLPLPWARALNVKRADVYIRPARGYPWPVVFLDDVAVPMAQRIAAKYATLVVHTSARGGSHLWLQLTRALDEAQRAQAQRWLVARVGADPGSVSGEHLGRLAGMKNFKRNGVWVNILHCPNPDDTPWDPTPALLSACVPKRETVAPSPAPVSRSVDCSESAREWGWVCGALEVGMSHDSLYQRLADRASSRRGPDAERYARRTIARALRHVARRT